MTPLAIFWMFAAVSALTGLPAINLVAICMLFLYLAALMGILAYAKWILLTVFFVCSLGIILRAVKMSDLRVPALLEHAPKDFLLYSGMAGLFFLCYSNFTLAIWDEFSHWGTLVKFLYWFQRLAVPGEPIAFLEYIPGISLFHYWVISLSGYRENLIVFSQAMVLFSIIFVMVHASEPAQYAKRFLSLALTVGYIYVLNGSFTSLMIDTILGTSWACVIVYYFRFCLPHDPDEPGLLNLILAIPLVALVVLVKASGVFLAYTAVVLVALHFVCIRIPRLKSVRHRIAGLLIVVALFATPWVIIKSWNRHVRAIGLAPTVYSMDLNALKRALSSEALPQEKRVVSLFAHALISSEHAILHPILRRCPLSVAGLLAIFAIAVVGVLCIAKDRGKKKLILFINLYLFIFFVFYCLGMIMLYVTKFEADGSLGQGSYARYISTYLYGWGFLLIYFGVEALFENVSLRAARLTQCLAAVLLSLILLLPMKYRRFYREIRDPLGLLATRVKAKIPPGSRIWFIQQNSIGFERWVFRYEMIPEFNIPRLSWSIGDKYYEDDIWTEPKTVSVWRKELSAFDYVVINGADQKFWQQFRGVFVGSQSRAAPSIYKVIKRPQGLYLQEIQ